MDDRPRLDTVHDLENAIEGLFPYAGEFNRAFIDNPINGARIAAETLSLATRERGAEHKLMDAMYEYFVQAKRTLGGPTDIGIMWRRRPFLVTEDDGRVILRMRMALVDAAGQIKVSGLPVKAEGVPSQSID